MKYYIHDNGGRPFMVDTNKTTGLVKIFKLLNFSELHNKNIYETKASLTFNAKQIFIGKSPLNKMTKFSGGHGKRFDGNSILLHINKDMYVYIGESVFSFKSLNPIIKYVSPVGNNDVPYPYAIDNQGNYYLMIENIILHNFQKKSINHDDPYDYYYSVNLITVDLGFQKPHQPIFTNNLDIIKFFIGNNQYTFRYHPNAIKEYNRLVPELGPAMYVMTKDDNKKKLLTKDMFVKLFKDFGKKIGLSEIKNKKILIKRQW